MSQRMSSRSIVTRAEPKKFQSWQDFSGPNLGYVFELYDKYLQDANAVDDTLREFFEQSGPPESEWTIPKSNGEVFTAIRPLVSQDELVDISYILKAAELVEQIREYGHLFAKTNPLSAQLGLAQQKVANPHELELEKKILSPSNIGLTDAQLQALPVERICTGAPEGIHSAKDAISYLKQVYTGTIAYELAHVHNLEERTWLQDRIESKAFQTGLQTEEQRLLLRRLIEVEEFEVFLQKTFVGQKRFSIEGVDALVPMLDLLIRLAVQDGTQNVMMGMAHRGRLNVLAHVLGKPYEAIFSEFHSAPNKELVPSEGSMGINYGWTGDVKYHLGAEREVREAAIPSARLILANNPSHLEFVNPVVEGFTRAAQDDCSQPGESKQYFERAIAILIHGDAAFPGEGVVAETLNLSQLRPYQTGGTVHIIANNQLGFTAEPLEGRSTRYASDLAKGFEIPIVHVSADDPEACLAVIRLAYEYRNQFHRDFLIDLIGYRRWGHNETDDPDSTQPQLYHAIIQHETVRALYSKELLRRNLITGEWLGQTEEQARQRLREAYEGLAEYKNKEEKGNSAKGPMPLTNEWRELSTGVPLQQLESLNNALLQYPEEFSVYPKLGRILERRRNALREGRVDWAHAEALAFASLLAEAIPIRLTGQDSQRGTFGQRNLVLHDVKQASTYLPLHHLPQAKAAFAIHNSPLSEMAVLGFEYGYDTLSPDALVLWEAQFGDFANVSQVIIDQFIASGWAKWDQRSGLVLLLPHGYEGQGPEHSSARLERYLQLSAEQNWRVAVPTRAAQYFHLLRRQALSLDEDSRPLIVMTPKSLLRNSRTASRAEDFTDGKFHLLLEEPRTRQSHQQVQRVVFGSGKICVDIEEHLEKHPVPDNIAVVRVEQLYPLAEDTWVSLLQSYPRLREVVWVQEEPQNMGAWSYISPFLQSLVPSGVNVTYIGRPARSSPAEGIATMHQTMQNRIIHDALSYRSVSASAQTNHQQPVSETRGRSLT